LLDQGIYIDSVNFRVEGHLVAGEYRHPVPGPVFTPPQEFRVYQMPAEPHMVQIQRTPDFIEPGLQSLVNPALGIFLSFVKSQNHTLEDDVLVPLSSGETLQSALDAKVHQTFLEFPECNFVGTGTLGGGHQANHPIFESYLEEEH
jgi:hypothetical protein